MSTRKSLYIVAASLILAGCIAGTLTDNAPLLKTDSAAPSLREMTIAGKNLQLIRFDPTHLQLGSIENDSQQNAKSIQTIHQENNSLLSFNGSFFSTTFAPLGLLVSSGKLLAPLSKSDLMDTIFTVNTKGIPQIYSYEQFREEESLLLPDLDFAIQSGPLLLDQRGKNVADPKNKIEAGRTAIGLDKDNNVVILMMRQTLLDRDNALTLYDFAELASTDEQISALGLHSLVNLDGGNSSGLAIDKRYFPELEKVQHVIITSVKSS